jgi:Acyl-CoA dehydrogenase, C-terminal domain
MDFDLSADQQARLSTVDEVVEACGGAGRALGLSRAGGHDSELDAKLDAAGLLDSAGPVDRVLIAERLAELGLATTFGLRAVLGAGGGGELPDGPVAVLDTGRAGPVRFGAVATSLLVLDGDDARVLDVARRDPREVRSSFGYPYAEFGDVTGGRRLAGEGARLRHLWRLALAAEIAGNAAAGVHHTAEHLRQRTQFGRPLATFQALRHRLADLGVSAEATRWMVREAAWAADPRRGTLAAWYAARTAAELTPELTQMCGARGFTLEFGLHVFTMRLDGLRLELGGPDRLATELAGARVR